MIEQEGKFYTCAHTGGTVLVSVDYVCPTCTHDAESTIVVSLDREKEEYV